MQAKILALAKEGASLLLRCVGLLARLFFLERVCIGYASSDFLAIFPPSVRIGVASFSGRPETASLRISEPSLQIDNGLIDHREVAKKDTRQPIVLVFAYRDRKAHYHSMMKHLKKLRRTVSKAWDLHIYVVEQMNNDLFRKGWYVWRLDWYLLCAWSKQESHKIQTS